MSHIPPEQHTLTSPPPVQHEPRKHYNEPYEDLCASPVELSPSPSPSVHQETISIATSEYRNIIIILIQDDSNSGAKQPSSPASAPTCHHIEHQSQPSILHQYSIMLPEQHAPPPSPSSIQCHVLPRIQVLLTWFVPKCHLHP